MTAFFVRKQLGLDGKEHTIIIYKDKNGTEKTQEEIEASAKETFEEMDRWQLIDIIISELSTYELAQFAQDDYGVWYE